MKSFDYYNGKHLEWNRPPIKPKISNDPCSEEIYKYAREKEAYDLAFYDYSVKKKEYQDKILDLKEEFWNDARLQLLCQSYPDRVWEKVCAKAWEDGHAYGFHEVYQELCELTDFVDQIIEDIK